MFPTLINFGPAAIHTYGLFVAIGFLAGFNVLLSYTKKLGLPSPKIESLVIWIFVFSIIGARLFYVIFSFGEFSNSPLDIFKLWQGGLVFSGGFLGGLLSAAVFMRKNGLPPAKIADAGVVALALGQAFGRLGCFFAGCCYGKECDSWFGVRFPENSLAPFGVKLVPVQLISFMLLLMIFFALRHFYEKKKSDGQVLALYLILYSLKRFFVEFIRDDFRGREIFGFTPTQILSFIMLAAGILLWKKLLPKKAE